MTHEFQTITIPGEEFDLEFSHIGEGIDGDYDSQNPEDKPLVRVSLLDKDGEQVESGSYCTQIETSATPEEIKLIAQKILAILNTKQKSPKKVMEEVSWFNRASAY